MTYNEAVEDAPMTVPSSLRARFLGPWNKLAYALGVACSLYYMWTALVGIHYPQIDRSLFIFIGVVLGFAMKPVGRSFAVRVVDVAFVLGAAVATIRFILMYENFVTTIGLPISDLDMALGWFMVAASSRGVPPRPGLVGADHFDRISDLLPLRHLVPCALYTRRF